MAYSFSPSIVAGLMAATATLACAALPMAASAQASTRFDGYCYVRSSDMQRHTATDSSGVRRASARCYKGEYYAYGSAYFAAPRAPDGYQIAYYTTRPASSMYDEVYDASGLPYGSDDSAQTSDDDSNGYALNDDSHYSSSASTGYDQSSYDPGSYNQGAYTDDRDSADQDQDQDQDQGSYSPNTYGQNTYSQKIYGQNTYSQNTYSQNNYNQGGYTYSDNQPSTTYSYGTSSSSSYGDRDPYTGDRYNQSGDRYSDGSYGNASSGDAYSSGSYSGSYSGDRQSTRAVQGWRDDQGQWHIGRPRAVGWEDDSGRWHAGEVAAYGWRDGRGNWHESQGSNGG